MSPDLRSQGHKNINKLKKKKLQFTIKLQVKLIIKIGLHLYRFSNFNQFSEKSKFLYLPGNTVRNLELFCNQNDGREKNSVYWLMNQTVTKFGSRKLKAWLTQPLLNIK